MTDGEALLQKCLLQPGDKTAQGVFADWLSENGEPECAAAMRGPRAREYLEETLAISQAVNTFPNLRVLWCVVVVCLPFRTDIHPNHKVPYENNLSIQKRRWKALRQVSSNMSGPEWAKS